MNIVGRVGRNLMIPIEKCHGFGGCCYFTTCAESRRKEQRDRVEWFRGSEGYIAQAVVGGGFLRVAMVLER